MKTELETRYTLLERDAEQKITKRVPVTEAKYTSLCEDAKNKAETEPEAEKVQTFKRYNVESIEDFQTLVPDVEEQLNIINRTLDIKETDAMRDLMTDAAFQGTEGAYDLAAACAAKTERKTATPLDKASRLLGKLSIEDQAAVLALLQARMSA
ncbi:MAG: hypothetical protein Q8P23_00460 [bacterium]|nr:hypothetical protein [bacterium]